MQTTLTLASIVVSAWTSTPAFAGECDGTPGFVLDVPDTAPIGSTVHVDLTGPAGEMGFFMVSLGQGPLDSSYGTICLDFPLALSFPFLLDSNGKFGFSGDIPCDPIFVDLTVYMQFITCRPNKGVSNQGALTITGDCEVDDSIASNFNGTDISAGNYVWFNAVVNVKNLDTAPATVRFSGGKISFSADGTDYDLSLPDSVIIFSDSATEASTSFDAVANEWQTVVPSNYSGNVLLSGVGFQTLSGLPGGINPVLWSGKFGSDTPGVSFQWKWAAAVYSDFSDDPNDLGVKPIDGDKDNPYDNSDHAGTPEAFKGCGHRRSTRWRRVELHRLVQRDFDCGLRLLSAERPLADEAS